MKKKISILIFCISAFFIFTNCSSDEKDEINEKEKTEVEKVVEQLWETSYLDYNIKREYAFSKIQEYADVCSSSYFKSYLNSLDQASESMEKHDPILGYYRMAFDKVINEIKNTKVEEGTSAIWMLYNMGYIVKTPSGCYGVDINHRYAEELEPYLDFLCVTHNHVDHYDTKLIEKMFQVGKPVISNYLKKDENYKYTATATSEFKIKNFTITTNITDHNTSLTNFVTTFQINAGEDGGNLQLMHVGDSNYKESQFNIVQPIDIFIARYAPNALSENNVIGKVTNPKNVLLSHILELSHDGVENSRWTIEMGLKRASKINCPNTFVPFWGEKLIWKNGQLVN